MTTFDAIIFDMDGLLVDSEVVWYDAEEEMIEARGFEYTEEVRERIIGLRVDEFLEVLRVHYNLPETLDELVTELNNRMLELIPHRVKPQPGAVELLEYVVEHNIPRAIASNSGIAIIDATIRAQGWDDIFTVRCTADDEPEGKPAPHVYLTAARRLGVDPARCLALEDSVNGSKAVVAAGMTCYAVPDRSHSSPEKFTHITPHIFESLHDVLATLKGANNARSASPRTE